MKLDKALSWPQLNIYIYFFFILNAKRQLQLPLKIGNFVFMAHLLSAAVIQTAYEVEDAVRFRQGSLSTLCTLTATLDSHEEAAHSQLV